MNRFNQLLPSQRYVSSYVPLPLDEILQIGALKQDRQDKAIAEKEQYLGKNWNRLTPDAQYARELKANTDATLAKFADKDFNDPQVKAEWYKTKQQLVNEWGPDGAIGAQEANYKAFQDTKKKLDEMLSKGSKDGGIDNKTYDYILNKALEDYNSQGGIGQKGPNGYNQIKFESPAAYQDIYKQAQDATAHWKADAISKGGYYDTSGQFIKKSTREIESIDPNEIIKYVTPALMADPMNQAFARQQAEINTYGKNVDPETKNKIITDIFRKPVEAVAAEMGYKKEKYDQDWKNNPVNQYIAKKQYDDKEAQKAIQFTLQQIPATQTSTSALINESLRASGNPLAAYAKLNDEGHLEMKDFNRKTKQIVNIAGKEYDIDNLPQGYNIVTNQGISYTPGNPGAQTMTVKGPDGKEITIKDKQIDNNELYKGMQAVALNAKRLGFEGDFEKSKQVVEDYLKQANNFQMNFPRFDVGTTDAMSKAFGVKMKKDSNGDLVIQDPGQLAFSTMKKVSDGAPISEDNLVQGNAVRLSGAKILGPAQSMVNTNYKPGDMYVQSTDGEIYLINSNNKTINDALTPAHRLSQSINKYVNTGERTIDSNEAKKLQSLYPDNNFTGAEKDVNGNVYYSFIKNNTPGVMMVDVTGKPQILELDEATRRLSQGYMQEILPSYNTKNFDRANKATQYDTEE